MIVQVPLRWIVYRSSRGEVFLAKKIGHQFRMVPFILTRDTGGSPLTNLILLYKSVQNEGGTGVGDLHLPAHVKPTWEEFGGTILGARVHYSTEPDNQVRVVGRNGFEISVPWE
jgi:hypothetical protein